MRWTTLAVRQLVQLHADGLTLEEIACRMGRPLCSVLWAWRRYGPAKRPVHRLADHEQAIRRLHRRGWCAASIGRTLHINCQTVARWMRRMNLASSACRCPEVRKRRKALYHARTIKPYWFAWARRQFVTYRRGRR